MGSATRGVLTALVLLCAICVPPYAQEPAYAQEPDEPIGYVAAIRGTGALARAGAEIDLQVGATIGIADEILTGAETQVLLVLIDGSRVVVGADTRITMSVLAAAGASAGNDHVIDLLQGILRISVDASDAGSAVETRTPTAVVAARSTAWIIAFEDDDTAVLALEGVVDVSATTASGTVTLTPGYGTDVLRGAAPTAPVEWGAARADNFRSRTAFTGSQ